MPCEEPREGPSNQALWEHHRAMEGLVERLQQVHFQEHTIHLNIRDEQARYAAVQREIDGD